MELSNLVHFIDNYKVGTYVRLHYKSTIRTLAAHSSDIVEKESSGVYRLGMDYYNIEENKEKERRALPYGDKLNNYLIVNNKDVLLRGYTTKHHNAKVKWFLNGVETTLEYLLENRIIGSLPKKDTGVRQWKVDKIISIG